MGLTRAGASVGDAGALLRGWLQGHRRGAREGGGGAGDLSSQKPCMTPGEIDGDVSSDQELTATSGGCARKGGAASVGERAGHA